MNMSIDSLVSGAPIHLIVTGSILLVLTLGFLLFFLLPATIFRVRLGLLLRRLKARKLRAAERYASSGHYAPNPFLFDFYRNVDEGDIAVPAEHIGLLYESVLAKSEPGDISRLSVEGDQDSEFVEVEISVARADGTDFRAEFQSKNSGVLRFGRKATGIDIDAEAMDVEIGLGGQIELVSPISINAKTLLLNCQEIVVKADGTASGADNVTLLAAVDLIVEPGLSPPIVRQGAQLNVVWRDSKAYPWTRFSIDAVDEEDPTTADALRALRRLEMSFRSHSKGRLARYKGKIEHARMMKGSIGEAIRERLLSDKILSLEGSMYFLDPTTLGAVVGVSFLDVKLKKYSSKARAYIQGLER